MTSALDYDVVIIGGGLVGGTLACALSGQDLRIALVEAWPFKSDQQPSYDDRSIALAYGSRRILEGIGLWPQLAPQATAIHRIHVSDRGHFGLTHLDCHDSGHDALGYVIENRAIGNVYATALEAQPGLDILCPAELVSLQTDAQQASVTVRQGTKTRQFSTRLLIGADGGHSSVRRLCDIGSRHWDYGQSAIIANITPEQAHRHVAYERFTDTGPLALLPMSGQRCSLVWTVRNDSVESLLALDDDAFLGLLQQRFGQRLGRLLHCGRRNSYPLHLIRARRHQTPRVALIGNAAHTLHPIAGQGFNLGIRDVAALAQVLEEATRQAQDIGGSAVLERYDQWRHKDQRHISALTDTLVRVFSNNFTPLVLARNAGLLTLDLVPPLKRHLTRQAMGLTGRLPRLARGLPL